MRKLGNAITSILQQGNVEYFFLVSIDGLDHSTSLPHNISMSNSTTYLSDNGLMAVEPPRLSTVVDREAYKVVFSDPQFLMRAFFEAGAVGRSIVVYIGFINSISGLVGSNGTVVVLGMPFLDMRDTICAYKGVIDGHGYEINAADSTVIATIEGASPMADLDMNRPFFTSKESIKQFAAGDTAYDQIYEGSGEIITKWGKD